MSRDFDPRKQRLSYASGAPKPHTLPKLTQLQVAVLACVRDDEIVPYVKHIRAVGPVRAYKAHGFDVTSQVISLRKRRLIKFYDYDYKHLNPSGLVYALTTDGVAELEQHPEF